MIRELPISPPEPVEVAECEYCNGEIYEGDEVSVINTEDVYGYVHDGNCAIRYANERVYEISGTINRDGYVEQ